MKLIHKWLRPNLSLNNSLIIKDPSQSTVQRVYLALLLLISTSLIAAPIATATPPSPVFVNGISQPVFDSNIIKEDYYVQTTLDTEPDGIPDRIHIQVLRSKDTDRGVKMPVFIQPSPYFESDQKSDTAYEDAFYDGRVDSLYDGSPGFDNLSELFFADNQRHQNKRSIFDNRQGTNANYLAARGFINIYAEALGTGGSTGCAMTDITNDGQALKAIVDWLNGRAIAYNKGGQPATAYWTTGKALVWGLSYNGYLTNSLMATGVPELKAAITLGSVTSFYDYYRGNGESRTSSDNVEQNTLPFFERADMISLYMFIASKGLVNRSCKDMKDFIIQNQDRITGNNNAWWDTLSILNRLNQVNVPVLVVHGLRDNNVRTSQSINLYQKLKELGKPVQLLLHQGGHEYPPEGPTSLRLRYGSQYLYNQETGISFEPKVQIYRENGVLTGYSSFPDPAAKSRIFNLQASGAMSAVKPASNTVQSLFDDASFTTYDLLGAASSNARLVFKTAALSSSLRLTGTPIVNLRLAIHPVNPNPQATTVAANLSVALADFAPDGSFKVITRGWMNPQNRNSNYFKTTILADQFYSMSFKMEPNDYVIDPGHRLAFLIYSTDNIAGLLPPPGTELKIDLAQTNLTLKLIGVAP